MGLKILDSQSPQIEESIPPDGARTVKNSQLHAVIRWTNLWSTSVAPTSLHNIAQRRARWNKGQPEFSTRRHAILSLGGWSSREITREISMRQGSASRSPLPDRRGIIFPAAAPLSRLNWYPLFVDGPANYLAPRTDILKGSGIK